MTLLFTVCIPTHNRAERLAAALESACRQSFDPERYEVLVVDSASSDATPQVVAGFAGRQPAVRCCREPQPGVSLARNRAASEARAAWLAYLDDDALAPPDWLETAAEVIAARSPDLLGGPFSPYYTTPKPAWFRDAYAALDFGPQARCLAPHEHLPGGNFFIRRELVLHTPFPLEFGPTGRQAAFGEETVLQRRLRAADPSICIYYEPRLAIRHWVAPGKMRLLPEARRRFQAGRWDYRIFTGGRHMFGLRHALGLLGLPAGIAAAALGGVWLRSRRRYPRWQNYYYEVVYEGVRRWGKLVERRRLRAAHRRMEGGE